MGTPDEGLPSDRVQKQVRSDQKDGIKTAGGAEGLKAPEEWINHGLAWGPPGLYYTSYLQDVLSLLAGIDVHKMKDC